MKQASSCYATSVLNWSKWNQQMWRPEVRFSNLLPGLLSNICTKPLSSDSNTRERNIKNSLFIFPSGGMQSLSWLTEPRRKEGLFLFSPLLPHDLVCKRSSNTTILLICTNLCCCSSFAWIFLFEEKWRKRKKNQVGKNVLHLNPYSQMQVCAYHCGWEALSVPGWILQFWATV